jgi:hypothetical protein
MITIKHRQTGKVMVEGNTYQECFEKLRDENGVVRLSCADLRFANLREANLSFADMARADLTGAYLTRANLTGANLRRTNLTEANLTEANMTEVNIDYASWPLWCGSLGAKVDRKILAQLAYHLLRLMPEKERGKSLKKLANEFNGIVKYNLPKL